MMFKEIAARYDRMGKRLDEMIAFLQKRTAPPALIAEERRKAEAKAKYEAAGIEFKPFAHAVEQQHVLPQNPGETTEQPNAVPDPTVEIQEPSTAVNQLIENTQPVGLDSAQPESELIGEEEACAGITESTIDALTAPLQVLASMDHDVRKAPPTPQSGEELITNKEVCEVGAVVRATEITPGISVSIMKAISANRIKHTIQSQLGVAAEILLFTATAVPTTDIQHYAFPVLLLLPTDRPPPKAGEHLPDARSIQDTSKPRTSLPNLADFYTTVRRTIHKAARPDGGLRNVGKMGLGGDVTIRGEA
jgi:hypothetical protein